MDKKNKQNIYYRVIRKFQGKEFIFKPTYHYESTELGVKSEDFNEEKSIYKEVCFSKKLETCFFSIAFFLEPGEYYIYTTNKKPCVDLEKCQYGDFSVFEEVRYRKNVEAKCIGKIFIDDFTIEQIKDAYIAICNHKDPSTQKTVAKDWLDSYKTMINHIESIY